jgi:hypothetical protein
MKKKFCSLKKNLEPDFCFDQAQKQKNWDQMILVIIE